MHALNMDSGAAVWDNGDNPNARASFGPTSAIPGVAFAGQVPFAILRAYDTEADAGTLLSTYNLNNAALASGPAVVDGLLVVGGGIGTLTETGSGPSDIAAGTPSPLTALCVPGTPLCNICQNGVVEPAEQCDDGNAIDGDGCSARCETESTQTFSGIAQGGTVSFIVNGVFFELATAPGDSAFDVAVAGAAAINGNAALADSRRVRTGRRQVVHRQCRTDRCRQRRSRHRAGHRARGMPRRGAPVRGSRHHLGQPHLRRGAAGQRRHPGGLCLDARHHRRDRPHGTGGPRSGR
ncbi:MAG: myxococcus cysteine-rich repeat containing protein [Halioglobus sp.]|nr:myxococcus cysteine-rich repeat containing protein [Halioglobus sp.]